MVPLFAQETGKHFEVEIRVTVYSGVLDAVNHEYAFEADPILQEKVTEKPFCSIHNFECFFIAPIFFRQFSIL